LRGLDTLRLGAQRLTWAVCGPEVCHRWWDCRAFHVIRPRITWNRRQFHVTPPTVGTDRRASRTTAPTRLCRRIGAALGLARFGSAGRPVLLGRWCGS